ncbi:MAG: YggS family pyridoxal phosphate-dependent enzyme [Deltaproteobacteria bacterium]|nr:MAG: YggS family pyridoxal phosphate-dependent enzyme [Deltaproteobacteria bacterium]TMQ21698.1 MAG: YggS family pyridoxal phosphate-dependent enzyme [Deltaproteobacteria bacterium]
MTIAERWRAVAARVAAACERAGRAADSVTIVAVSKTQPVEAIRAACAAGATDLGENYAQELAAKAAELAASPPAPVVRWHFIGRLQRNKARLVAGRVALVHAVDGVELADEIARRAGGTVQPILLAVNLGDEATKGGVTAEAAPAVARAIAAVAGASLDGLMTMPPPHDDPEASRPYFDRLRALRDRLEDELARPLPVLSMGMSHDYEVAIACGATHVRIGTAIFGSRS